MKDCNCTNRPGLGLCVCQQMQAGSLALSNQDAMLQQAAAGLVDHQSLGRATLAHQSLGRRAESLQDRARRRIKELRQEADRLQAALDLLEGLPAPEHVEDTD